MSDDPDDAAVERLRLAVADLSPLQRTILRLSSGEGLSNTEIADRLGISRPEVERELADATLALDRRIGRSKRPWWRFW